MKRSKGYIFCTIFLVIALFLLCEENPTTLKKESVHPIELMPEDNEISGWVTDSSGQCIEGIADTDSALFELINGPGQVMVDFGFVRGAFKGYVDKNNPVDTVLIGIEIFDQGTSNNAQGLYKEEAIEGIQYEIINDCGDAARLDSDIFTQCLEISSKNYFIRLTATDNSNPYREAVITIGSAIVKSIEGP